MTNPLFSARRNEGKFKTGSGQNLRVEELEIHTVTPATRMAATRAVASNALDVDDCATLLDMLGLEAGDGKAHRSTA